MKLKFILPVAVFALCSCAGNSTGETAAGGAVKFMRYCLDMQKDSASAMCEGAVMDSLAGFFDIGAPADSSVNDAFRKMLSSSEVTAVSEELRGKDTSVVRVSVEGSGKKYEGRLLMVRGDGGWSVSALLSE